jgi:hypothetical protein
MRYRFAVTANSTLTLDDVLTIELRDGNTGTALVHSLFLPSVAPNNLSAGSGYATGWIDLGNGILSAAANNVLNVNLSSSLTAGVIRFLVCGTEE